MTLLAYPQLPGGAPLQFPVEKRYRARTAVNVPADGRAIRLADPQGELTEWRLEYAGLADSEILALEQFFGEAEGTLYEFTFLDPTENLFAWSGQLDNPAWSRDPFLTLTAGLPDPTGGANAWHAANAGAAGQKLSQVLQAPAGYLYCLSIYARSSSPGSISLLRGGARAEQTVDAEWRRLTFSGRGSAADFIEFGIELPAGAAVDLFGPQVEPQEAASVYKPSTLGGVYSRTHFQTDVLASTATGVNRHSVTVNLIHAKRL